MAEKQHTSPDLTAEQAKGIKNTNDLVTKALENKNISGSEGREIIQRLQVQKERITQDTKNKLADFLKDIKGWDGLKKAAKEAQIDGAPAAQSAEPAPKSEEKSLAKPQSPAGATPKAKEQTVSAPKDVKKTHETHDAKNKTPKAKHTAEARHNKHADHPHVKTAPVTTPKHEQKPTTAPQTEKIAPAQNTAPVDGERKPDSKTETVKEKLLTAKEVQKEIDKINALISDDAIQSWEEAELKECILKLQENRVLVHIPEIQNGVLPKWMDLLALWETIIGRLEEVRDDLESTEAAAKAQEMAVKETQSPAKAAVEQTKTGQEAIEKSRFMTGLWAMKVTGFADKIEVYRSKLWTQEERTAFKNAMPDITNLKSFDELTSNARLDGTKLAFNIDPDGWDSLDTEKTYTVKLDGLDLSKNAPAIQTEVVNAYVTQIKNQADKNISELAK